MLQEQYLLTYLLPIMPLWHIGQLFCCFRNKKFLRDEVVNLKPNPHTWRAVGLTLVWTLLLDLSGLGGPTRGVNTPAGIALGVIGTHKPLSHVKATVPVSRSNAWNLLYQD